MSLTEIFEKMQPGSIKTIAGAGYKTGVPATEADIGWPSGIIRRPNGDLVFGDIRSHRIWRIDSEGIIHNFAGDGVPDSTGDGGPASKARVHTPHDFFQDVHGNIFFIELGARGPDEGPNILRRIDHETGIITTVAGSGKTGRGGEGLPAVESEFDTTCGVAVDDEGNIYICHKWDSKVTRIDCTTGLTETIAGLSARNYLLEEGHSRPFSGSIHGVHGYHGDGGPAKEASLNLPEHIAFDSEWNLYICDNSNNRIRKIDKGTGIISTVLGTGDASSYGDGGLAINAATDMPDSLHIDHDNNIYVGEAKGNRLRRIDAHTGIVTTIAGTGVPGWGKDGVPANETMTNAVEIGIWVDPDKTVFYSDSSGRVRMIDPLTGIVTTIAGGTGIGDGGPAIDAYISNPCGLSVGEDKSIYIADMQSDRIRKIDHNNTIITTIAGSGGRGSGGNNAKATNANFLNPYDVAVDLEGRIVIADSLNAQVRVVDQNGNIQAIAGSSGETGDRGDGGPALSSNFIAIHSIASGPDGRTYIGDMAGRIRVIDPLTGLISTYAGTGMSGFSGNGQLATKAQIGCASAIDFDGSGNLYFSDLTQHVIRKIDSSGVITTIAGTGKPGFSTDGTIAIKASLFKPMGIAVKNDGTVFFSDSRNNRVRSIEKDGSLITIAGSNLPGDSGDGGIATNAKLNQPTGLSLFDQNTLLISDHYNNRIKAVKL